MKIEIIEATVASGKDVFPEDEIEVKDQEGRKLIRLGKAKAAGGSGGDGDEITLASLKKIRKKADLIEVVNREFDLNADESMKVDDILDLAEAAIDERGE